MKTLLIHNFISCMDYLDRLVEDVQEDQMTAQPAHVINHPAWTLGHLTVSCQMICEDLNISPWLPEEWFEIFMEQPAIANSDVYPNKESIIAVLEDARHRLIEHVKNQPDENLTAPFPQILCSEMFPTLGHALNYGMNVHTSFHIGQLSAWRRAMQLPVIKEFPDEGDPLI